MNEAYEENRLEAKLKHYTKYKLLIIDEIGYLPIDKRGANLLFQLINRRYEKKSTITPYTAINKNLTQGLHSLILLEYNYDKKYFLANKILAKHDENYMPPEVSEALEKSN